MIVSASAIKSGWCIAVAALFIQSATAHGETLHTENIPATKMTDQLEQLSYEPIKNFFSLPAGMNFVESSAVAINSKGHIFVFHRIQPYLLEFDEQGKFLRSLGDGLFSRPHGLRVDAEDNIWTTDTGNNMVLKLSGDGQVLLALGYKNLAAEGEWLFNQPTDVAIGRNGDIYVADGYGNSRIVKFNRDGNFIKAWGKFGTGPSEFNLPHSIVIDADDIVYVADRENMRVQLFNADGRYLKSWTDLGYPYALSFDADRNLWLADGGYDRILKLNRDGKILGTFGEPGRAPGQLAWAHGIAVGPDGKIFVAEVLSWRVQVFRPTTDKPSRAKYIPTSRMFFDHHPSNGWLNTQLK